MSSDTDHILKTLARGRGPTVPLEKSPHFAWVYPSWGALPVFATVYGPFFAAALFAHDRPRERQECFLGGFFALDAALLVLFGPILRRI